MLTEVVEMRIPHSPPFPTPAPLRLSEAPAEFQRFVIGTTLIACALQVTTGWHCGVLSGTMHLLEASFELTMSGKAIIGTSGMLGTFLGGLFAGQIVDQFGRRRSLLLYCITSGIFTALTVTTGSIIYLNIVRICAGSTVTLWYATFPALVGEIAPPHSRGKLLAFVEACWFVGFALAVLMTFGLHFLTSRTRVWKYVHSFPAIIHVTMGLFAYFRLPETPAWLIARGRMVEAREVCNYYMKSDFLLNMAEPAPEAELRGWRLNALCNTNVQLMRTLFGCLYWSLLVIPSFPVTTYSLDLLTIYGIDNVYMANTVITSVALIGVYGGCILVDRTGRRWIAIPQFVISATALLTLGLWSDAPSIVAIILLGSYALFNAAGAVLTSTYPAELFPTHIRGAGTGLMASVSRLFAMLGTFAMPYMLGSFGAGITLTIFGTIAAIGAIICYFLAPETSGKTLAEVVIIPTPIQVGRPAALRSSSRDTRVLALH